MKIKVSLNGTDTNPWAPMGLTQNPFPQYAKSEYDGHLLHLAALGGEPIPDTEYIRRHLRGWSEEFIDLCCDLFQKGKMVEFEVTLPG